jgi:hypothetical protein
MDVTYKNENRRRYYGLRIGDIVNAKGVDGKICIESKVVGFTGDNNSVYIESDDIENPVTWVAEWCDIKKPVEERIENYMSSLQYFWDTKEDIERWAGLSENYDIIMLYNPEIIKAWEEYKAALKNMGNAVYGKL